MAVEYDGRRVRVPKELAARIDAERGQVPFNRWCVLALEKALAGEPPRSTPEDVPGDRKPGSASSRAPQSSSLRNFMK